MLNQPATNLDQSKDRTILMGGTTYVAVAASGRYVKVQGEHDTPQYLNAEDITQWEPSLIMPKVTVTP